MFLLSKKTDNLISNQLHRSHDEWKRCAHKHTSTKHRNTEQLINQLGRIILYYFVCCFDDIIINNKRHQYNTFGGPIMYYDSIIIVTIIMVKISPDLTVVKAKTIMANNFIVVKSIWNDFRELPNRLKSEMKKKKQRIVRRSNLKSNNETIFFVVE